MFGYELPDSGAIVDKKRAQVKTRRADISVVDNLVFLRNKLLCPKLYTLELLETIHECGEGALTLFKKLEELNITF